MALGSRLSALGAPRANWVLVFVAIAAFATAACGDSGTDLPLSKPFAGPPWTSSEELSYEILEGKDTNYGYCTLRTTPEFEPGRTRLEHLCDDGEDKGDEQTVEVDSQTLEPLSSVRVISDTSEDKRDVRESIYDDANVIFRSTIGDEDREVTRELPEADDDNPDPGYYDDYSLFWLVRGVPLEEGFEAAYADVNSGIVRLVDTEILVEVRERVEVPAGEFDTWKVRIKTGSIARFWVEAAAPHRVIRAEIQGFEYVLVP